MSCVDISESNFEKEVMGASGPVLLEFWAPWCGPCSMMGPMLEELAAEWMGQIKIVRVNVDENQALAIKYRITCIPTIMVFCEGRLEERLTGGMPKHVLESIIKRNVILPSAA